MLNRNMVTNTVIKQHSIIGTYHQEHDQDNQDVLCYSQDQHYSVISLADGVSTCSCAKRGAEIASQTITDLFLKNGARLFTLDDSQVSKAVLSRVMQELNEDADKIKAPVNEYASTLASVLIDKRTKKMLCFSVGDGIIMALKKDIIRVLAIPSDSRQGCIVTTTRDADLAATVKILDLDEMEAVIICSDGAWQEMFSHGRLKPEIREILCNHDFDNLSIYLKEMNTFDDHSFIAIDLMNI